MCNSVISTFSQYKIGDLKRVDSAFTRPLYSSFRLNNQLSTSTGSDNIPDLLIIRCADYLCNPLTDLFNLSLGKGEYPDVFKLDHVVPILKRKGRKNNIENHRPI